MDISLEFMSPKLIRYQVEEKEEITKGLIYLLLGRMINSILDN